MDYKEYLKSAAWQRKRNERLKMDKFKCAICGRPMDLQVHHLNYTRLGNESVENDLITLCKYCHKKVEDKKTEYKNMPYHKQKTVCSTLVKDFIAYIEPQDKSAGGKLDLCRLDIIKPLLFEHMRARGYWEQTGSNMVQNYFANKRRKIILDYYDKGYPKSECQHRTNFSYAMITKVYDEPEIYRFILNAMEENDEQTK